MPALEGREDGPERRLSRLGLELPPTPRPIASYRPFRLSGELITTSGVLAMADQVILTGRLGREVSVEQGREAARGCALSLLSLVAEAAGGLDRVLELIQLTAYVRSAEGFSQQPEVADGASELLVQVLGPAGEHARVAVGVSELPRGACLELQLSARRGLPPGADR